MCALGEGEEGGEGGREQRASQRLPYPSAELPELRRGGGGREGKAKAGGLGAARAGSAARRGPDPRAPEAGGWLGERPPPAAAAAQGRAGGRAGGRREPGAGRARGAAPRSRPAAQPGRRGPWLWGSGEPVMNDRTT